MTDTDLRASRRTILSVEISAYQRELLDAVAEGSGQSISELLRAALSRIVWDGERVTHPEVLRAKVLRKFADGVPHD